MSAVKWRGDDLFDCRMGLRWWSARAKGSEGRLLQHTRLLQRALLQKRLSLSLLGSRPPRSAHRLFLRTCHDKKTKALHTPYQMLCI